MDWITILKAVGVLIGAVVALVSIRKVQPRLRPRNRLKADLEILNQLKALGPPETDDTERYNSYYDAVRKEIDTTLARVYHLPREKGIKVHDKFMLVLGIISFLGFSYWVWSVVKDGFSWWVIVPGFFVFFSIIWITMAFEKPGIGEAPVKEKKQATVTKRRAK